MKYRKQNNEKIVVGEFVFKKRRLRLLLYFIKFTYAFEYMNFLQDEGIAEIRLKEGLLDASAESFIEKLLQEHAKDILWYYEGNYVYNRALRLLAIRPRSRKELYDFAIKNLDNKVSSEYIMEHLETFIDDNAFAEYLITKERGRNPKGDRVIRAKLKEKGIDEDIVEEMLHIDEPDVLDLIKIQYNKKERILFDRIKRKGNPHADKEFIMKMKIYLMGKGFSISDIDSFFKQIHDN